MSFMKDMVSFNPIQGTPSSKRFVLVIAGVALSISVIILSAAAAYGVPVAGELWAVTSTLAALAGVSYVGKKDPELPPPAPTQMLTEEK